MRLLVATPLYPPESGGPATYAKLLAEGLPALGVDVLLVKFGDVRRLPVVVRHIAYLRRLVRDGRNADVILALDPVSTGLPAALAAFILRKPFVLKVVGDYAWEQGRQRFGITDSLDTFARRKHVPVRVGFLRSIETWVAHRADQVIVPSEYLKSIVELWCVPAGKITVIYNAVPEVTGGTVPDTVLALPEPRVLTIARLVPWKGIRELIDAVGRVQANGQSLSLVVVGDGPDRKKLETHAARVLKDTVVFTGALTPEDTRATLHASTIFALNSTYEGLSHVLIEAMSMGLPIVATRVGGNPEVLGDAGMLVPSGDTGVLAETLLKLAESSEIRAGLGDKARTRSSSFSVSAMLSRTKALLETV